jgi:hypothetical protein
MKEHDTLDEVGAEERQFAERAKQRFDSSVERLDAATLSRLNRSRQAALAEAAARGPAVRWSTWAPVTGLAAAAAVAAVLIVQPAGVDLPDAGDSTATDFEILLGDDSLEMIEELEFYSWIDIDETGAPGNVG